MPIVYEVGSRDGKDGVELAQRIYYGENLWLDSEIVLFECNPPQQELIKNSYPEAILIKEAIANEKGTAEFVQIAGDMDEQGSSSMDKGRLDAPYGTGKKIIEVKTRRLISVIEELGHQDKEIDIMKIDIEGYTWEALQSLGKYLRNVRVFHLETEIKEIARNKDNLEVFHFMESNGYRCTALENEWGHTIQDQVWVRI